MRRAWALAAALASASGLAFATPAGAERTPTQGFFTSRLLADKATSDEIKSLLRSGNAFVDPSVKFTELTGDKRADAVVRVQTGGAAGTIALYVFSTDTGKGKNAPLSVVFRTESLERAETRIRAGVLRYRTARYAAGDERCCPTTVAESRLRWREAKHRFEVVERRLIAPTDPWGDQLAAPPTT
jgi:hypothetical protein